MSYACPLLDLVEKVHRGVRECDRLRVIIKVLSNPFPHFNELVQFRNQYVTAKNLDHPNIDKPLALEPYQNGYALMMEDFGGISLRQYLQVESLSLEEILAIAVQMAEALHYLSQHRVVLTNPLENAGKFTSGHSSAKIEFGIIHQNKETIYI